MLTFSKNCSRKDNVPTRDSSRGYLNVPVRGSFRGDPLAHFPAPTVATRPREEPLPAQDSSHPRPGQGHAQRCRVSSSQGAGGSLHDEQVVQKLSLDSGFKGAQG